ncbi:MAG: CvpA family protein [Nitrospirae bacterium]|nr:CvpA family protein [Nitrospirota bacterium]
MNAFDMAVVSVMAVTALVGLMRGAAREVFSLVSVVAGFLLAARFHTLTSGALIRVTSHEDVNGFISFLAIFIFTSVLISYAGGHFTDMLKNAGFRLWNTLGGPVIGALKGLAVCTSVTFMMMVFLPAGSDLTAGSAAYPYLSRLARLVSPVTPESLRRDVGTKLEQVKDGIKLPEGVRPGADGKGGRK